MYVIKCYKWDYYRGRCKVLEFCSDRCIFMGVLMFRKLNLWTAVQLEKRIKNQTKFQGTFLNSNDQKSQRLSELAIPWSTSFSWRKSCSTCHCFCTGGWHTRHFGAHMWSAAQVTGAPKASITLQPAGGSQIGRCIEYRNAKMFSWKYFSLLPLLHA